MWRKVEQLQGHVTAKIKSRGVSWAQETPEKLRLEPTQCGWPHLLSQAVPFSVHILETSRESLDDLHGDPVVEMHLRTFPVRAWKPLINSVKTLKLLIFTF